MPRKDGRKSSGGATKRQEISVYARKGMPKAAQKAAKAAKGLGNVKAGRTYIPTGMSGLKSGSKYAPGSRGPSRPKRDTKVPLFGDKADKAAKAKFEATKKKLAGKKSPSLGISKRRSSTGTGAKKSIGYQGMRPGPLR